MITMDNIITALLIISVGTNLSVEALKRVLNDYKVVYSSNCLAFMCSTFISTILVAVYLSCNGIAFTLNLFIVYIALIWLGFLVAVLGYDKVIQAIRQVVK